MCLKLPYDETNPKSIEKYASLLIDKSFRDILGDILNGTNTGKGGLGTLLEEYHFKYKPNSDKHADFKEAGVELKATPFKQNKNKTFSAKERLVLNIINFNEVVNENFEHSSFWDKNKLLLLIYYLYDEKVDRLDYKIKYSKLFTYPKEDLKIIKDDWNKIINKICEGKAHELSEGDTFYLGACTKGKNANSLRNQPFSDIKAKQRAFSLKSKYMTYVLNEYIMKDKSTYEPIIKDASILENQSFEEYIINKINENKNLSRDELSKKYDVVSSAKNITSMLAMRMLGVKTDNAQEFEKANIKVKAIRVGKNGKIKEHMSFKAFKFTDIAEQPWEECDFREELLNTKYLFVIFKFDDEEILRLEKCMFWNMPYEDIETDVKDVFEKTKGVINEGIKIYKKGKKEYNNLPGASENRVSHVRPHAQNKTDTYLLPNGQAFTKQSFWLNNSYILEQINKK